MIQKLKNGRHKVTVDRPGAPGATGGRNRVCRTVSTLEEAKTLEAYLRARPGDADGRTVSDAVERYLTLHGPRLAPQTELKYRSRQSRYVDGGWIGAVRLDRLDEDTLERYYAQMLDGTYRKGATALSTWTVRKAHCLITAALGDVRRLRWVKAEQYEHARVIGPAPRRRADDDYDLRDVARIIDEGDEDLAELAHLAIATGARLGELAALRWRDVDLSTGVVSIEGSVSEGRKKDRTPGDPGWHRKTTKTGKPRRLRIDASCVAMLEARYARQWAQAVVAEVDELDDRVIMSRELELEWTSPKALGLRWLRAAKAAGLVGKVRFHDLRGVNASEMLAGDVSPLEAQRRNGWSSASMLLNVYGHRRVDAIDRATPVLEATWAEVEAARRT